MSATSSPSPADRPHVQLYTDGGCEPNPGPGGYGAVLIHPRKRLELSGGFRKTTNNRMEIRGVIAGLEALKQPCRVTVRSDSKYVVDAMMAGWVAGWKRKGWWRTKTERPENVDLWQRLDALCQGHRVEFLWVKGHAGVAENERCDELAMHALRQAHLPEDHGYENRPVAGVATVVIVEGQPCQFCTTPVVRNSTASLAPSQAGSARRQARPLDLWCPQCHARYPVVAPRDEPEPAPTLF